MNVRRDGTMKFEEDFDFETANAQFHKDEIDKELQNKLKLKGMFQHVRRGQKQALQKTFHQSSWPYSLIDFSLVLKANIFLILSQFLPVKARDASTGDKQLISTMAANKRHHQYNCTALISEVCGVFNILTFSSTVNR